MFWNTLFMPVIYGIGFCLAIVIVWLLGLELYAVYALILSFVSTGSMLTSLGIPNATSRFVAELDQTTGPGQILAFLKRVYLAGGGILLAVVILLNLKPRLFLERFALEAYGPWLVVGVSAIMALRVVGNWVEPLLKAFFQHRTTNLIQVVHGLIRPTCVAVALIWSRDVRGVLVALILAEAFLVGLLGVFFWRYARQWPRPSATRPVEGLWGRFMRFAATTHLVRLVRSCVQAEVVIILLALALKKPELALIAFAYNVMNRFMIVIQRPVIDILGPYFNYSAARYRGATIPREAASLLSKGIILVFVFGAVGLACFAPRFVELLFPPEFHPAISALVVLLSFFFAERIFSWPAVAMLFAYERNKKVLLAESVLLLNIPLLFISYKWLGVVGPALSSGALRLAASYLLHVQARKEFLWSLSWSFLGKVGTCSLLWGGALTLGLMWAGPGWLATMGMGVIGALLLIPCMAGPRWFTTVERSMLLALEIPGSEWALRLFRFAPAGARPVGQRT